jgi:hypothetical protein
MEKTKADPHNSHPITFSAPAWIPWTYLSLVTSLITAEPPTRGYREADAERA